MYRRAVASFRIVESGESWYCSMHLGELNRNIPESLGFDNFELSYSSAVFWGVLDVEAFVKWLF